jgi:hypothetical protein
MNVSETQLRQHTVEGVREEVKTTNAQIAVRKSKMMVRMDYPVELQWP